MKKTHKLSLTEAGRLEGSELGEYWEMLEALECRSDMMSPAFEKAYEAELKRQRISLANEFRVIESKVTREEVCRQIVFVEDADYDDADDIEVVDDD